LIWHKFPNRLLLDVSLWSANLVCLAGDVARLDEEAYADLYHFDVSDAHFAPGLLFFPDLIAALRPLSATRFHIHLMSDNPAMLIDDFARAGANIITVHVENGDLAQQAIYEIKRRKLGAGVAVNLDTPVEAVKRFLYQVDLVLLMNTEMGIKGIEPSKRAYERIRRMRQLIDEADCAERVKVFCDGGIRANTAPLLRAAGADGIVPGSLVFMSDDLEKTFEWIRSL
jgi:ribulose-phosphate 3-epimerase